MQVYQCLLTDELFTHVDEKGVNTTYNVTQLQKHPIYKHTETVVIPVDREFAIYCLSYRGVEPHRLASAAQNMLVELCALPDDGTDGPLPLHLPMQITPKPDADCVPSSVKLAYRHLRVAQCAPLTMLEIPEALPPPDDVSHLLIDGTHRYVAAWEHGAEGIRVKIVKRKLWKHFVVEGLPDETAASLLKQYSGL